MIIDQLPSANPNLTDETVTEQGTNLFKTTWQKIRDLFLATAASFSSDVTVGGVLDVANRRAYATLAAAGWYRVLTYNAASETTVKGTPSFVIDFVIGRGYSGNNNGINRISLVANYNSISFVDEISVTNAHVVDKIRYTYSGATGYVDIHCNTANSNYVYVEFDVKTRYTDKSRFVQSGLTAVADAPTGETIVTTHTFSANGFVPNQSILTSHGDLSGTGTVTYTISSGVSVPTATWKEVASLELTTGTWLIWATARFASNATGYRKAVISTASASSTSISINFTNAVNAVNGDQTFVKLIDYQDPTVTTTFYLNAYQNSGSSLSTTGRLYAMRIC